MGCGVGGGGTGGWGRGGGGGGKSPGMCGCTLTNEFLQGGRLAEYRQKCYCL